jgi:hypothetical protein
MVAAVGDAQRGVDMPVAYLHWRAILLFHFLAWHAAQGHDR